MMSDVRRALRAPQDDDARASLGSRLAVRIVNISLSGVLLETSDSNADITHGDELELTVPLGRASFSAKLAVSREARLTDGRTGGRLRVACVFVNLDPARRQQLADFLADGLVPSRSEAAE